jgi:hypothetical protein
VRIVGPISGDLVVKLALGAAAIGAVWYAWRNRPDVGDLARRAGNAATDTVVLDPLQAAAKGAGDVLVGTVNLVPGLSDYLKRISTPVDPASLPVPIAAGTVVIDGQTFNFGY